MAAADFCTATLSCLIVFQAFGQALLSGATTTRMPSVQISPDKSVMLSLHKLVIYLNGRLEWLRACCACSPNRTGLV